MGHENAETTLRYIHTSLQRKMDAVEQVL